MVERLALPVLVASSSGMSILRQSSHEEVVEKAMKRADQITGALLFLLSLGVLFETSKLDMARGNAPGPGFLPFWLALGMALLSAILLVDGLRRSQAMDRRIIWPSGRGLRWICLTIGGLLIYTGVMPLLGYILSTFALIWLMAAMMGQYRWYRSAAISLSIAFSFFLLFRIWLGMSLPTGLLIIP